MFYAMYRTSGWAVLYYMALIILGNFLVSCRERAQKPALAGHTCTTCAPDVTASASLGCGVCMLVLYKQQPRDCRSHHLPCAAWLDCG